VLDEAALRRHLKSYLTHYHDSRTHLSLGVPQAEARTAMKNTPESRPVQTLAEGRIVAIPQVGGLHHRYESRAA